MGTRDKASYEAQNLIGTVEETVGTAIGAAGTNGTNGAFLGRPPGAHISAATAGLFTKVRQSDWTLGIVAPALLHDLVERFRSDTGGFRDN